MKFILVFIFISFANNSNAFTVEKPTNLNSSDELPLITTDQFAYIGGFRIKSGRFGESRTGYSSGQIAFNNDNLSLFLSGHVQHPAVAEFPIPDLVKSENLSDLNISYPPIQNFTKILDKTITGNKQKLDRIGGMEYIRGELLVNAYLYYDAPGKTTHTTMVIRDAKRVSQSIIDGYYEFTSKAHGVLWISPVPKEWQAVLAGDYIVGASSAMPINGRSSMGPSAFTFNSKDIVKNFNMDGKIKTVKLLDYDLKHILSKNNLGWLSYSEWIKKSQYNYNQIGGIKSDNYDNNFVGTNNLWTQGSKAYYGIILPGTRTYAVFGYTAMHKSGGGYKIKQKNGNLCGGPCAYDPDDYQNYYWFYDVNDLLAVKQGIKKSYEILPYSYGVFEIPIKKLSNSFAIFDSFIVASNSFKGFITSGAYNKKENILYLSIPKSDKLQNKMEPSVTIIAFKIDIDIKVQ